MIALDTSVVVACFASWHEHHDRAVAMLDRRPELPGHVALEAYSVLTRLPDPFRAAPGIVAEFLTRTFARPRLVLDARAQATLPGRLAELGIAGGAVHDAHIAFTAESAGAELVTLDQRAFATYDRCGVRARLM